MTHLYRGILVGLVAWAFSLAASADALHGFCSDCVVDNMIGGVPVTSTGTNPPSQFGFWSGGSSGLMGNYVIDILTPDNGGAAPSNMFSVLGGMNGSATAGLFSTTAWTSQGTKLDSYLGMNASPANPLGAWLPATQTLDPNAMGYWVFQADLGNNTLGTKSGSGPLLSLGSSLPAGSLIVAFLSGAGAPTATATANSSAIFETGTPPTNAPEPGTMILFAAGLLAIAFIEARRRTRARRSCR